MSGLVSKWAALVLALIATALLVWAAYHYAREWHKARNHDGKRGLDSWYFIAPCLVVAIVAIAGAAYGYGLRSSSSSETSNKVTASQNSAAALINNPQVEITNDNVLIP